jgi:hypothetical protein
MKHYQLPIDVTMRKAFPFVGYHVSCSAMTALRWLMLQTRPANPQLHKTQTYNLVVGVQPTRRLLTYVCAVPYVV